MYKVIVDHFTDGENGHPFPGSCGYKKGDTYPNGKYDVTDEHIKYLLGDRNAFGKPLIAPGGEEKTGDAKAAKTSKVAKTKASE